MNRRETERILEVLAGVRAAGERVALATIVRVKGSAYRREGARLVIRQDGTHECLLSGGCLEPAVADAAARVIATGEPALATYNLEDDSVWGLGIGCSGEVDIRIERLDDTPVMHAWLEVLTQAETAVLLTPLAGATGRLLVRKNGEVLGSLTPPLDSDAMAIVRRRLSARFPQSGPAQMGHAEIFFEFSTPPPHLAMFGAGHDAVPLARGAWDLGFTVTVVDVREAFLTADRFPHVTLVPAHFSQFADAVPLGPRSFVVVMNHHLERDQESLRFALRSEAPYVGLLGPRSRFQRVLAGLASQGYVPASAALARVRNPIGLAVGAETPEEIAVSILGELLAVQRGFDGGFLTGLETTLHRSADTTW